MKRVTDIWLERAIFKADYITKLLHALEGNSDLIVSANELVDISEINQLAEAVANFERAHTLDTNYANRIASLPAEVFDVDALWKIKDKNSCKAFSDLLDGGGKTFAMYEGRLMATSEDRSNLIRYLASLIYALFILSYTIEYKSIHTHTQFFTKTPFRFKIESRFG